MKKIVRSIFLMCILLTPNLTFSLNLKKILGCFGAIYVTYLALSSNSSVINRSVVPDDCRYGFQKAECTMVGNNRIEDCSFYFCAQEPEPDRYVTQEELRKIEIDEEIEKLQYI